MAEGKPSTRTVWTLGGALGLLLILFALIIGPWLFTQAPQKNLTAEQELKAKNDVRTTLVQALAGLAVAGGLIVTYHTYRQNQAEQERNYQQRHDEQQQRQIEQDRTYERELYATALEQLGHDQAPVRLGALYSLASLAQDRPTRRQMVVDVLCAYLRMPYTPPARPNPGDKAEAVQTLTAIPPAAHDPAQELQVRQTAQRLLATHLRPPPNTSTKDAQQLPAAPEQTFWPAISIDLTGATLVEFDFSSVSLVRGDFRSATFSGAARFFRATFSGDAEFTGATFSGDTWFPGATFEGAAGFGGATFSGLAAFDQGSESNQATSSSHAWFGGAKVLHLDDRYLNTRRSWPPGWIVRPDPVDPAHGELTRADQAD